MDIHVFIEELESTAQTLAKEIAETTVDGGVDQTAGIPDLLRIALINEVSVADLAATWVPSTVDYEIKLMFARQAGDEARHFELVSQRLAELGHPVGPFEIPLMNPLFQYLRGLDDSLERIAAGTFALELLAYEVNERFIKHCDRLGDAKTAEIYRKFIQPEERHHHDLGKTQLKRLATTPESQAKARSACLRTLETARELRKTLSARLGTNCFPGC